MNEYGSITIDNRNLLDDLLGLAGEHQNELNEIYHHQQQYDALNQQLNQINYSNYNQQQPFQLSQRQYQQQQPQSFHLNHQLQQQQQQPFQLHAQPQPVPLPRSNNKNGSNSLQGGVVPNGQKVYLESPTFDKEEDDMYRYVNSGLGSNDAPVEHNVVDSLDANNSNVNAPNKNSQSSEKTNNAQLSQQQEQKSSSNTIIDNSSAPIRTNSLAPLRKNSFTIQQNRQSRDNLPKYQNELLDSLDQNTNQNTLNQQANNYNSNTVLNNPVNPFRIYNSNPNLQLAGQDNIYDPANQFYIQQQNYIQQYQQPQYQTPVPLQTVPFVHGLPPPNPNYIPANGSYSTEPYIRQNSNQQFYNQPPQPFPNQAYLPIQQQQQRYQQSPYLNNNQPQLQNPNMFYQEALQPAFYSNNQYPSGQNGNDYYSNQPNYQDDLLNYQDDYYNGQPQHQSPPQQRQLNNVPNGTGSKLNSGNKYTAQPLIQPPLRDSPEYDDDNYIDNDINNLKTNLAQNTNNIAGANNNANAGLSDEDIKRQQVWNKLQKANRDSIKNKGRSDSRNKNSLPPVGANGSQQLNGKQASNVKKNVKKEQQQPQSNHIERNVEIIKNKENLIHRYPEKKYEVVYGKNLKGRVQDIKGETSNTNGKKPPHHLQPIDPNFDDHEDQNIQKQISISNEGYDGLDSSRKISIPLNSNLYKNNDHINLDINLKLTDFIPQNNNQSGNHQQQRNINRYYDDFEIDNDPLSKHIRRFEGISKSLPGSSGSLNKTKPLPPVNKRGQYLNNEGTKLQHEYELTEHRVEEGYLARLQKEKNKPVIKTYTLKDYRNFKKDVVATSATNTGKLGFDYENDGYKKTIEITNKKNDYAERVKERNRILLAEQQARDSESTKSSAKPASKSQRAKEYAKNNIIRPKSGSRPESKQLANDKSIIRVRDPITSKVNTLHLTDQQLNELTIRHEQDKVKVNSFVKNPNASGKRQPVNFNNGTTDIMSNSYVQQKQKTPVDLSRTNIYTEMNQQPIQQAPASHRSEQGDDDLEKMMQRHNAEKQRVNTFNNGNPQQQQPQMSSRSQNDDPSQGIQQDLEQEMNKEYENNMNNSNHQQLEENLITT